VSVVLDEQEQQDLQMILTDFVYMPLLPALSALTPVMLMFAICNVGVPLIQARWSVVPALLGAVVLIFPLGFLAPYWLGSDAFGWPQRIAVTYSSGMKNLPIAVGLSLASLNLGLRRGDPTVSFNAAETLSAALGGLPDHQRQLAGSQDARSGGRHARADRG
jgi:hypothetical protein